MALPASSDPADLHALRIAHPPGRRVMPGAVGTSSRAVQRAGAALALVTLLVAAWALAGPRLQGAEATVYLLLAVCGLLAGFLSGLLGIGGALVVVPTMVLLLPWLGVAAGDVPHVAIGSSLLAMVPSALAATRAQYQRRTLDGRWLRRLAPGMLAGAILGGLVALALHGSTLSMMFALQSLYYGWGLVRPVPLPHTPRGRLSLRLGRCPSALVGPLVAAFCTCAGMGGGSLTVPYLLAQQVALLRAVATSSALNLTIAVGGVLAFTVPHALAGTAAPVCWPAALIVGGCAVASARHGVALAHRLPLTVFRRLLGGITLIGATVLILRTLWAG